MEAVPVQRDLEYRRSEAGPLVLDTYQPLPAASGARAPVVLFVTGFPDVGVSSPLGCMFKDMEMSISLLQLIAMSGMAAVSYTTSQPATDIDDVLAFLTGNATALHVDATRVGLWAVSGHAPVALSALIRHPRQSFRAAVISNGFTFDAEGAAVADAARTYGFVNACAGHSVDDVPPDVPLFIARSGRDEFPGLNDALDRFVTAAISRNLPLTCANHPMAPHSFELNDDSALSRHIIDQMLAFMRFHLT
jgi:hypothetical protein